MTGSRTAIPQAVSAMRDGQVALRPGNPDVKKTPFLVQVTFELGSVVRQKALFQANQEDLGKFESFRGVKRDQRHSVRALIGLFFVFPIQSRLGQETG